MFLCYQNDFLAYIAKTKEEVENVSGIFFTRVEEVNEPAEMIDGCCCVGEEVIKAAKAKKVRNIRDGFLECYVDKIAGNLLRWEEMSSDDKKRLADYRRYLLDLPQHSDFPEVDVKAYEVWQQEGI